MLRYLAPTPPPLHRCCIAAAPQGVLSTTGHSTNFVMTIELTTAPGTDPQPFLNNLGQPDSATWTKAGVAAVCSLRY